MAGVTPTIHGITTDIMTRGITVRITDTTDITTRGIVRITEAIIIHIIITLRIIIVTRRTVQR